ncbi:hypothetical protein AVEN_123906-1 [Araneus ventricosus]|uniref:Uncharacterized protein n=1 Tax=Araneus ventricosus TaxID=182803 RepID=A0A4Y2PYG2_ARAVE|nr:hypothetical protein AVEN_123906-1 [Araneus ventricosus]
MKWCSVLDLDSRTPLLSGFCDRIALDTRLLNLMWDFCEKLDDFLVIDSDDKQTRKTLRCRARLVDKFQREEEAHQID